MRVFKRRRDGTFNFRLAEAVVALIVDLGGSLDELLDSDDPNLKRLFPTAYPNDPEMDAGYQILARSELVDERHTSIETVRATANNETLTEEELSAWMRVINDVRLVLGTKLDVSESDDFPDEDDPHRVALYTYHLLGEVLSEIVNALSGALPPAEDD